MLTVIASEGYDQFTRSLQQELAELVTTRPKKVNYQLFSGQILYDVVESYQDLLNKVLS